MKLSILVIGAIMITILASAGGFVAGMAITSAQNNTAQSAPPNFPNGVPPGVTQNGQSQLSGTRAVGQIKSVNGDTLEISTADKVITVKVNDQTVITKNDSGTVSDLQVGDNITVFSLESGENPTASRIQVQSADLPELQGAPTQPPAQ